MEHTEMGIAAYNPFRKGTAMEFEKILELIQAVNESQISQLKLQEGDWKISIKKEKTSGKRKLSKEQKQKETSPSSVIPEEIQEVSKEETRSGNLVKSPLVGTFYHASSPDSEPFVKEGDLVQKGQVLGLVEAMKLMNEIESEYDGVVKKIMADNGQMVEYGQPLFLIE